MLGMSGFACEHHEDRIIHILMKWCWKYQGPPVGGVKKISWIMTPCVFSKISSRWNTTGAQIHHDSSKPKCPPRIQGLQGGFRIASLHVALSNSPTSKIWKASSNVKDAVARCSLARRASASLNSRAVSGGEACATRNEPSNVLMLQNSWLFIHFSKFFVYSFLKRSHWKPIVKTLRWRLYFQQDQYNCLHLWHNVMLGPFLEETYDPNHPKAHRYVELLCWITCPPPWDHTSSATRVVSLLALVFHHATMNMKGMDFPKYSVQFFCRDFPLHSPLWYYLSVWRRSMLLLQHKVSVSSQSSYQGGETSSKCC